MNIRKFAPSLWCLITNIPLHQETW